MQTENDEWGRDPAVRGMRKVFAKLEHAHNLLLKELRISWLDPRLGDIRDTARVFFERALSSERGRGRAIDDRAMIGLYLDALSQALRRSDISIPQALPTDYNKIMDEVMACSG